MVKIYIRCILAFILSVIGGICERAGGSGNYSRMWREIGVPVASVALLLTLWHPVGWMAWVWLIVSLGACIGAISTYRYWFPKPTDYTPAYFGLYGFMNGLAFLPLISAGLHWYGIVLRAAVLLLVLELWDKYMNRQILCWNGAVVQEFGRGFFILVTIPLVLI